MENIITSIIRTSVPYIVGALVSWLTVKGISIEPEAVTGATAFLTVVFGELYYILARLLESHNPQFGILLGIKKQPVYPEQR